MLGDATNPGRVGGDADLLPRGAGASWSDSSAATAPASEASPWARPEVTRAKRLWREHGLRVLQWALCATAFVLAARSMKYGNGVPFVAARDWGMSKEDIAEARACGNGFVTLAPRCEEVGAPVASWLANPALVHLHGPPALISLVLGVHNLMLKRGTPRHIILGRIYAVCVLFSAPMAILLALRTTSGLVGFSGFTTLAVLWASTAWLGVRAVRVHGKEGVAEHRRWMVRNYALTFSAVTIRFFGWLCTFVSDSLLVTYSIHAWLGWVPCLLIAEAYLRDAQRIERVITCAASCS
mmetsp:Transcript_21038/g.56623  ORF Transcript_21038/g.56623 Transcript_21038/m.56623 type:complete len:296 (+) Transcript_21038:73-960(+)